MHPSPTLLRHAAALSPPPAAAPGLLDLVDFKWLMAGLGHCIDLDRLQDDRAYLRDCLALAAGSDTSTLRQAAQRLATGLLGGGGPAPIQCERAG